MYFNSRKNHKEFPFSVWKEKSSTIKLCASHIHIDKHRSRGYQRSDSRPDSISARPGFAVTETGRRAARVAYEAACTKSPRNARFAEQLKSGNDANFSELDRLGHRSPYSLSPFRCLFVVIQVQPLRLFAFYATHIKRQPRVSGRNFAYNRHGSIRGKKKVVGFYKAVRGEAIKFEDCFRCCNI